MSGIKNGFPFHEDASTKSSPLKDRMHGINPNSENQIVTSKHGSGIDATHTDSILQELNTVKGIIGFPALHCSNQLSIDDMGTSQLPGGISCHNITSTVVGSYGNFSSSLPGMTETNVQSNVVNANHSVLNETEDIQAMHEHHTFSKSVTGLIPKIEENTSDTIKGDLCRVCASPARDLVPLFVGQGLEMQLVEKIHNCLPIKVQPEDELPMYMCNTCSAKLDFCHDFVNTSIAADSKLRALYSSQEKVDLHKEFVEVSFDAAVSQRKLDVDQEVKYETGNFDGNKEESEEFMTPISQEFEPTIETYRADISQNELSAFSETEDLPKKWPCSDCDFKAARKSSLVLHKKKHRSQNILSKGRCDTSVILRGNKSKEPQYSCEYCDKTFQSQTRWQKHERSHTLLANQHSQEVCSQCQEEFLTQKELHEHLRNVHGIIQSKKFRCDQCDKSYSILGSLDIHRATHSKETPYLCDLCGKSFKHASNLRCHKRSHAEDSVKLRHACSLCPKTFISKFHLSEHQNVHMDIKPYACPECGKKFHRRLQVRQHRFSHATNNVHECPQCGARFNRRGNMTQHMKRHLRDKKFSCKVCKASFPSLSEVIQHRREHSSQDHITDCQQADLLSCPHCHKNFNEEQYDLHVKTHLDNKAFQCSLCEKRLSNRRTLEYHMRSFHTGERPYPCQFCSESFLSKEGRIIHERHHTGEKPYVCSVCNMSFRCSSNLSQHTKTHTEDRPWACEHCPKRFKRKGILLVHLRTHTGERPFCCDICGRRFTQKNDMLKHQQTHNSSAVTYICADCNWCFHSRKELNKHRQTHFPIAEAISDASCIPPHSQAVVITTEDITNFPITIMETGNNIIVHRIDDASENTQVLEVNANQSHIVHLAGPVVQTATGQGLLLPAPEHSHIVQLEDGSVVIQSQEESILS